MSAQPEDNTFRNGIYERMNLKSTDELLAIWQKNDRQEWTDMAMDVVRQILVERLGEIPPQEVKAEAVPAAAPLPTQDERVMAALAHLSIILPFWGMIGTIIIWVTQKDKSRYVAFHALQALAFQLTMMAFWFLAFGCYMLSFFSTFIFALAESQSSYLSGIPFIVMFLVIGLAMLLALAFFVYGIVGAVRVFMGKPFHYLLIGNWVEKFMQGK